MKKREKDKFFDNLPACAAEFIKLVIKKMRYRKKVRADVMAELIAHFEDELKDCKTDTEKEQKAQKLIKDFGDAKLLGILLRRAKKRCRPLWRTVVARTFQTIGVLILCFIVYVVWFLTGKPVITTNYIAELNRMVQPVADESLNAAPLYNEAASILGEETPKDISKLLGKSYGEATPEEKQLIEKWITDNKKPLELVIIGSKKPYYWQKYKTGDKDCSEMMGILLPHLGEFRILAYSLRWRAELLAEQGRYEDAFDDIKSCYRLGRHLTGDQPLIEQLVGMAIENIATRAIRDILSEHKIESATLANLQEDLEHITAGENFFVSFKAEKLSMYDALQRCFTDDRIGYGHIYPKTLFLLSPGLYLKESTDLKSLYTFMRILFTHPNKLQTQKSINQLYDYAEDLVAKTAAQDPAETNVIENKLKQLVGSNIFLELLTPAIQRVVEISNRLSTDVNSTLAIIAILRYKQDKGSFPESLDELITAGYLKKLPIDSWSDKPLVYRKTDDDFLLYSVSMNFTDDGGKVESNDRGGPMIWGDQGDAVFWPVMEPRSLTAPTPP